MHESHEFTVAEFTARRFELPEAGRWTELVAGRLVQLAPPDDLHGNVVLNLSKALADFLHAGNAAGRGCACFDLGVVTTRDPDTVRFPAVSYYSEGDRFAQLERTVTHSVPALVVEIASTNDRRREIGRRIEEYHAGGTHSVWIADTHERVVHVADRGSDPRRLTAGESLRDLAPLEGFAIGVAELFAEPAWYRGG